jgi:hypothetical protein
VTRVADLRLGAGPALPGGALDRLARLEVLVDLEEVLDLQAVELRHVVDVADVVHAGVAGHDADDLVVAAGLVAHPEHPDGARHSMMHPGNVGSSSRTRASSGSPSRPRVSR